MRWWHQLCLLIHPEETPDYKLNKVINLGGRSVVYKGTVNSECVIIKKTNTNNEIPFIAKLQNVPGVVQYKTYFFDKHYVYIVMQKKRNTLDLFDYVTQCNNKLNETITKSIIRQLISIVLKCKERNVLHNDIKETNILIDPISKEITLIDFDAAEEWIENFLYTEHNGTWRYSCPEWHAHHQYTADGMCTWSIGIVMYSLLCGELPFDSASEIIYQDIPSHDKLPMSKQAYNFLTKCLDKNNVTRIKLNDMLSDEWFSDY